MVVAAGVARSVSTAEAVGRVSTAKAVRRMAAAEATKAMGRMAAKGIFRRAAHGEALWFGVVTEKVEAAGALFAGK